MTTRPHPPVPELHGRHSAAEAAEPTIVAAGNRQPPAPSEAVSPLTNPPAQSARSRCLHVERHVSAPHSAYSRFAGECANARASEAWHSLPRKARARRPEPEVAASASQELKLRTSQPHESGQARPTQAATDAAPASSVFFRAHVPSLRHRTVSVGTSASGVLHRAVFAASCSPQAHACSRLQCRAKHCRA